MDLKTREYLKGNLFVFKILSLVCFAILLGTLFKMQIVDAHVYQTRAESNRMRLISISAPRGDIISRDEEVLVRDYPSFDLYLTYMDVVGADEALITLVDLLNDPEIDLETIHDLINENRFRSYAPIIIKRGLSIEEVSRLEARKNEIPGIRIIESPKRVDLHPNMASHVLGFTSEIGPEVNQPEYERYRLGDLIGKVGIEKEYESYLRGVDGFQRVEVNAKNRPIGFLEGNDAIAGNNVMLTIDFEMQKLLDDSFDELLRELQENTKTQYADQGAVVLMEVKTGRILAMSSRPHDPIRTQNKVIQGRYIPGSTFKMITGMAALEYAKIDPQEIIYNRGAYWEPPYIRSIARIGPYNYYSGMAQSDNVYFQEMGRRAGIKNIAKIGEEFGLHLPTGIDLPYESLGSTVFQGLPNEEKREAYFEWAEDATNNRYQVKMDNLEADYKQRIAEAQEEDISSLERERNREINKLRAQWQIDLNWNTSWHAADTYNVAIGQGRQNYTPLQLASYVAQLANDGIRMKPYIVEKIFTEDGELIKQFEPEVSAVTDVSKDTMEKTIRGMVLSTERLGTSYGLFGNYPDEIPVAAKSGTAQRDVTIDEPNGFGGVQATRIMQSDGLYTAFAPADNPEIVFFGVVEAGNSGSGSAGRLAKILFDQYFGLNQPGE